MFIAVNTLAFAAFGLDKAFAVKNRWRIKESTLLILAFLGGFGALCGMYFFHHKTKKPKFYITVPLFAVGNIAFLYFAISKFSGYVF